MYKHILIPTDGSALSNKAAKAGTRLARSLGARVTALYVIEPYRMPVGGEGYIVSDLYSERQYMAAMKKHATRALEKVVAAAKAAGVKADSVTLTDTAPWRGIVKAARSKRCDVIVMASHGRRGLEGLLLGSETTKVLTHSKTPVLVCR